MLQIYTDNRLIDFSDDISVDLVFENPLLTTDRIPATYSLSYDLPLTPRNREIFGNPDRAATGNDRFSIEYDDAILEREVFHDLRLENGYTISREEGQKYVLRYSSASDGEQADAEIREAVSVVDGLRVMDSSTYVMAFRSRCPPQALQADSESVLHLTVVKAYRAEEAEDDDDDEASTYDMTIQARPVQCLRGKAGRAVIGHRYAVWTGETAHQIQGVDRAGQAGGDGQGALHGIGTARIRLMG